MSVRWRASRLQQGATAGALCPYPCAWTRPPPGSLQKKLAPGSWGENNRSVEISIVNFQFPIGNQANPNWQLAIDNWKSGIALVFGQSPGCGIRHIRRFTLVAKEPAHVRQGALGVAADCNQFGGDGHGDLFRRDRSNV